MIIVDQRRGGINGGVDLWAPRKLEKSLAVNGIHNLQPGAREKQRTFLAGQLGDDGGRVAGFVIGGFPSQLSVAGVQRNDARAVGAADIQQHAAIMNQWRAPYANET